MKKMRTWAAVILTSSFELRTSNFEVWSSLPIAGFPLKKRGGPEERSLLEVGAHDLQGEWQTVFREAGWNGNGRDADQIRRRGEDVREIHGKRIVGLGADGECHFGGRRRQKEFEFAEGRIEVASQTGPHRLGPTVIRVVV